MVDLQKGFISILLILILYLIMLNMTKNRLIMWEKKRIDKQELHSDKSKEKACLKIHFFLFGN